MPGAIFLVTLEVRLKRRRALAAIHELRAMAHIIDMHQLTKDPDRIGTDEGPRMASGRLMSADEVSRYRTWDRNSVVFHLKLREQDGEPLNSGALQRDDPGLHAAAVRYFKTYDTALRAAGFRPGTHGWQRRGEG